MTNETDRELLELAAKAAGLNNLIFNHGKTNSYHAGSLEYMTEKHHHTPWNPLNDDGDALRLAVELDMEIAQGDDEGPCAWINYFMPGSVRWLSLSEQHTRKRHKATKMEKQAATRRAIVRAAAEIGKAMK